MNNDMYRKFNEEDSDDDGNGQEQVEEILESTILATTSDEHDEDNAIFRSVDIMPASSFVATTNTFDTPTLTQSGPLSISSSQQGVTSDIFSSKAGLSVVERSNWKVPKNLKMPAIPLCHPLERTHVIIPLDGMNVQVLTALISDLAQRLSLACDYESDCQAYMTAEDGTLLSVQLFRDEDDFGDDSTIVEVQRRAGKTETFFFLANKLLQVSKGIDHVEQMDLSLGKPQVPVTPLEIMDNIVDVASTSDEEEIENSKSTLSTAVRMLRSELSDSQELGLKLLEVLTDSNQSSMMSCRHASQDILTSKEFGDIFQDLIYQDFSKSCTYYDDDLVRSYNDVLKKSALQVLANSLSICVNENVVIRGGWLHLARREMVSKLVELIDMASVRPHEALLSMRCLEGILLLFPEAREQAVDLDLAQIVMQAKLVGECSHANLYRESERLVGRMADAGLISA